MTGLALMSKPQPIYRIDAFTDRVFGALVIVATLAAPGPAPGAVLGAELTVEVVGLRSDDGNVHFALDRLLPIGVEAVEADKAGLVSPPILVYYVVFKFLRFRDLIRTG